MGDESSGNEFVELGNQEGGVEDASSAGKGVRVSKTMPTAARRVLWDRIWQRLLSPTPQELDASRRDHDVLRERARAS
jgi:hypothetical protein